MPAEVIANGSRFDALLLPLLAAGLSYADAAAQAGVSERTVKRRMADPSFKRAVATQQHHNARETSAQLQQLTRTALDALRDLLERETAAGVRLAASRTVLEQALRWQETAEIDQRLQQIEEALPLQRWAK